MARRSSGGHVIGALWPLIEAGRIKVYSLRLARRAGVAARSSTAPLPWLQNQFHELICARGRAGDPHRLPLDRTSRSLPPALRSARSTRLPSLCRHPDAVRTAIGLSGTYNLEPWMRGHFDDDFYFSSPWHFLPGLGDGWQLDLLRRRSCSWRSARAAGRRPASRGTWRPSSAPRASPIGSIRGGHEWRPRLADLASHAAALPRLASMRDVGRDGRGAAQRLEVRPPPALGRPATH